MTDLRFSDLLRYLPFADPAHAPEWTAEDRPAWFERKDEFPVFRAFCLNQLDELDRRAREWSEEELEALPNLFNAIAKWDGSSLARQERTLAALCIGWAEFEKLSRRTEAGQTGPGPTVADPRTRAMLPAALAAQDMAKLRFVIFPRFWGRKNLASPWPEQIAAERRGCAETEARSWYNNNGVPADWEQTGSARKT